MTSIGRRPLMLLRVRPRDARIPRRSSGSDGCGQALAANWRVPEPMWQSSDVNQAGLREAGDRGGIYVDPVARL
jgi:hypothetical protein